MMASIGRLEIVIDRPGVGVDPDWSYALYACPPSHDFLTWVVTAELMRRVHNGRPPLKVAFLLEKGQLGIRDYGNVSVLTNPGAHLGLPMGYSNQMLAHVLRPAIDMIGGVNLPDFHVPVDFEEVQHYCEYTYFLHTMVDASREGFEIPLFDAPKWAKDKVSVFLDGRKPIVITLREASVQPERNSALAEWMKFAHWAKGKYDVLFLRDTALANCQLDGWPTWHLASNNAYIRLALYQAALVNMMVGNGPMGWTSYSDAPYLAFKQLIPSLPDWEHGTIAGWKRLDHLDFGDNLPWAKPNQKFTWKDDTFENIQYEFLRFLK